MGLEELVAVPALVRINHGAAHGVAGDGNDHRLRMAPDVGTAEIQLGEVALQRDGAHFCAGREGGGGVDGRGVVAAAVRSRDAACRGVICIEQGGDGDRIRLCRDLP